MSDVPVLKSCVPFPIDNTVLEDIVPKAKDWAIMHGAAMRSKTNFNIDALQFAPFILTPSSFPRKEFEKAIRLQTILNELMHWVANDAEFLRETLASTIKVDEFTRNLFTIYEHVLAEGKSQANLSIGLLRSDYLAHYFDENAIKQVEINTIASSFGGLTTQMTPMHSFILQEMDQMDKLNDLPPNLALSGLCDAMIEAWNIMNNPLAVILFVVENITYNICDQRFHEFQIRQTNPNIKVIRKNLKEIYDYGILGNDHELIIDGTEVSVVYFRSGYEPGQYPTENEWSARLLIERSKAIKCPTINYHLAGTKKVQQALAKPGILKRFLNDEKKIEAVREIFTGLYSLDKNEHGDSVVKMALENPEQYVLKPQREGGGNNVYGADIPAALLGMTDVERSAWVLMERIFPPISKGYMVRPGGPPIPEMVDLVSELGIFGAIIGNNEKIIYNKQAGHMLRTKLSSANEGGVAAGLGALDSPYLIDE